jgi:hypothetical protein
MGAQGSIPFSNDTTSREAAESIEPEVNRLEQEVLSAIKFCNGLACHEVEQMTGMAHTTASARIRGLVLKGLVYDSGQKKLTPSKRNAIVWRAR